MAGWAAEGCCRCWWWGAGGCCGGRRRGMGALVRGGLIVLMLAAGEPDGYGVLGEVSEFEQAPYTTPGSYTYTLTATDGKISHSATYSLQVTAK